MREELTEEETNKEWGDSGVFKIKNILSISGVGLYNDIEPRIIDIAQRYLKCLKSNNYGILVNRSNDYYTINVVLQDKTP